MLNERLYFARVNLNGIGYTYTTKAITSNDARIKIAQLIEQVYGLRPARWEAQPCGRWLRTYLCTDNPRTDEPRSDGFLAAIFEPEMMQ